MSHDGVETGRGEPIQGTMLTPGDPRLPELLESVGVAFGEEIRALMEGDIRNMQPDEQFHFEVLVRSACDKFAPVFAERMERLGKIEYGPGFQYRDAQQTFRGRVASCIRGVFSYIRH